LKLAHKIYVIIGLFCTPLIVTTVYFIVTGKNKDIDFAAKEKVGNVYQRSLESLLEHVSQHQLLAARMLQGDKSLSGTLADMRSQIDGDFQKLMETDKEIGATLDFTERSVAERKKGDFRAATVEKKWKDLSAQIERLPAADANAKHADLINDLNNMIVYVGDKSNLILDPDLDAYYVMDVTLVDLPLQQTRLAEIMVFGAGVLQRQTATAQERRQMDVYAAMLKRVDRDNVKSHSDAALIEDEKFSGLSPSLQKNVPPAVKEFVDANDAFAALLERIGGSEKTNVDLKQFVAAGDAARKASFGLWNASVGELDTLLDMRIAGIASSRQNALLLTGLALLGAGVLSVLMIRAITRSIGKVAQELHELASAGADLTRRIQVGTHDEIGRLSLSFNNLMDKLLGLVKQVQRSGTQVASSSTEIAASTKQLETSLTEQASSTHEVVATTKEISATSQTLVETMNEVSRVASETANLAGGGRTNLEGMESTMRQLANAATSISSKLAAISEKTNNINKVVTTITKVADQTNLLSLNASIEAEKAGEQGLGFAVVAREIRRLADQTAVATLDIERIVREMQSAVSTGVMEMDKFTTDVAQSVEEVNRMGTQLNKIIEQVQVLAPRFETVTGGMEAQSQGAQQIEVAMVQLSEAARQTMDSLRQTNGAIADLHSAAQGLHQEVSRFNTAKAASS
jgi:methyl-accepting chemotaxis protein